MGKRIQRAAAIVLGAVTAVLLLFAVLRTVGTGRGAPVTVAPAALPETSGYAVLDLNRASEEELQALPGIGVTLAERIVRWREENGAFRTKEDVLAVQGIGEATYERIAPYISY